MSNAALIADVAMYSTADGGEKIHSADGLRLSVRFLARYQCLLRPAFVIETD
jgi:hypothetical protein